MTFFYSRNAHSLEFGLALERIEFNESGKVNPNGQYAFGSLQAFLTNQPRSFASTIPGKKSDHLPAPERFRLFYARDDYRVRSNLTLNLGIRYEMATVPAEKYGRLSNLDNLTAPTPRLGAPPISRIRTLRNFSPRVGPLHGTHSGTARPPFAAAFGIYDILPLTYQFELLALNAGPYFQTGSLTTLPQRIVPERRIAFAFCE